MILILLAGLIAGGVILQMIFDKRKKREYQDFQNLGGF